MDEIMGEKKQKSLPSGKKDGRGVQNTNRKSEMQRNGNSGAGIPLQKSGQCLRFTLVFFNAKMQKSQGYEKNETSSVVLCVSPRSLRLCDTIYNKIETLLKSTEIRELNNLS
jgi:hypothetical protein